MSLEENKDVVRRYLKAIDDNDSSDWSVLDEFLADDFVMHNAPLPGVTLDREGMKQAAEMFRVGTPGHHEIRLQVAEGDLVVSHVVGFGVHKGEIFGVPPTNNAVETEGMVVHRIRAGKISEFRAVVDAARVLQQLGVLPAPHQ